MTLQQFNEQANLYAYMLEKYLGMNRLKAAARFAHILVRLAKQIKVEV